MYRAIGLYVYRKHVPEEDTNAIGETAKETEVSIRYIDGERHVYLNGEDVSEEIRKEHIVYELYFKIPIGYSGGGRPPRHHRSRRAPA